MVSDLGQITDPLACRRLVIKIGSALLVEEGSPRAKWLGSLVAEIAALRECGQQVILVSSGAIALGAARLGLPAGGRASLADAQAAASVGQVALAQLWAEALGQCGLTAAQMLITIGDLEDRRRYLNASATLERLLEAGAVPVVNENDSVATEEIRFGDNDRLAARVAQAANADAVLLLSDVDGLFDRPPDHGDAKLVRQVNGVTEEIESMASEASASGMGSGGMTAKIRAAQIAERAGIALGIINGMGCSPIARLRETGLGTLFLAQEVDDARKSWLGGRLAPAGSITVDSGCAQALIDDGASVLAVGITAVDGSFQRGDLITICAEDGGRLAQGLSEYDAVSCRRIAGLRQAHQARVLGYAPRAAVVHRDHLVLL